MLENVAARTFAWALGLDVALLVFVILLEQRAIALGASALRDIFTPRTAASLRDAPRVLILSVAGLLDLVPARIVDLIR